MNARLTTGNALAPCVLGLLVMAACAQKPGAERPPSAGDVAVARVDGATIWASDVKREAVAEGLVAPDQAFPPGSPLFAQALEEVVDQDLLAAEAVRRGLDKSAGAQRRLAAARQRVLADLVLEGVVAKTVHEDAVQGLYQVMVKTRDFGLAAPHPWGGPAPNHSLPDL